MTKIKDYNKIFIGREYKVVRGEYKIGFIGKCVTYDPSKKLPVIFQNEEYSGWAGDEHEIEEI